MATPTRAPAACWARRTIRKERSLRAVRQAGCGCGRPTTAAEWQWQATNSQDSEAGTGSSPHLPSTRAPACLPGRLGVHQLRGQVLLSCRRLLQRHGRGALPGSGGARARRCRGRRCRRGPGGCGGSVAVAVAVARPVVAAGSAVVGVGARHGDGGHDVEHLRRGGGEIGLDWRQAKRGAKGRQMAGAGGRSKVRRGPPPPGQCAVTLWPLPAAWRSGRRNPPAGGGGGEAGQQWWGGVQVTAQSPAVAATAHQACPLCPLPPPPAPSRRRPPPSPACCSPSGRCPWTCPQCLWMSAPCPPPSGPAARWVPCRTAGPGRSSVAQDGSRQQGWCWRRQCW